MEDQWKHKIFSATGGDFDAIALEIFRFQYHLNPLYRNYADALRLNVNSVDSVARIPFLPIRFFKSHVVQTTEFVPQLYFESSGTTGSVNSRHYVKDPAVYIESFTRGFRQFYGQPEDWCILGLLPSYLERGHSSLVYMADQLIRLSGQSESGFYLNDYENLSTVLRKLEGAGKKTLLIGVTYALLDFAERFPMPLRHTVIMETGGMKGRRTEMVRQEVHEIIKGAFELPVVHSEYGMTELFSQAYSSGEGVFRSPSWMRILLRDEQDPLSAAGRKSGAINVIDLANIYSCSFIATDDAGRLHDDGSFEVLGRLDNTDIRGCSLLAL